MDGQIKWLEQPEYHSMFQGNIRYETGYVSSASVQASIFRYDDEAGCAGAACRRCTIHRLQHLAQRN